jgi:hypothetical protein
MKIPDVSEIVIAWHRAQNPTEHQARVAEHRAKICDDCEHKVWAPVVHTWKCGACGCPISKKVYSPKPGVDACPKSKWDI